MFVPKRLRENLEEIVTAFKNEWPLTQIAYSVKTNYTPEVLRVIGNAGFGADVTSELEVGAAIKAGIPYERMCLNGPAKSENLIQKAVTLGFGRLNLDNWTEINWVTKYAKQSRKTVKVGLRVTPKIRGLYSWSKFGFSIDDGGALEACRTLTKSEWIKLVGLQFHLGTSLYRKSVYSDAIGKAIGLMNSVEEISQCRFEYLDIGGGFPSRGTKLRHHGRYLKPPSIREYARVVAGALSRAIRLYGMKDLELILEPGRFVVDDSFDLLVKVVALKNNFGERWVIVDGGVNLVPFGAVYIHPVEQLSKNVGENANYLVGGPLCMQGDFFLGWKRLRSPKEGNILKVSSVGAYGQSFSTQFIFPRPATVLLEGNRLRRIRRAETVKDVLSPYV